MDACEDILIHPEPRDFTTFWFSKKLKVTRCFLVYRCLLAAYFLVTLLYLVIENLIEVEEKDKGKTFAFFTTWNYIVETATFLLGGAMAVFAYCLEREEKPVFLPVHVRGQFEVKPKREMPFFYKVFWILYTISLLFAHVVTAVYFTFLFKGKLTARDLFTHILNSVIIVIDFGVTAHPIKFFHCIAPQIYLAVYFLFTVVYDLCGGTGYGDDPSLYNFITWRDDHKRAIISFVLVETISIGLFLIFCSLSMLKLYIKKKHVRN